MTKLKLLCGSASKNLTREVADILGIKSCNVICKKFKDTEIYVKIDEKIRGEDLFIIQSVNNPVNDNLMELLIMIDAAKRASAGRINVVIPYFGYARQDRKASSREPITAKLVANLLETAGADRVITVDLHADQIQGFFDIPVDHFVGYPLFAQYISEKKLKDVVIVSPDTGFAKKARRIGKLLNVPIAIVDKRRPKHNKSVVMNIIGDVKGKNAIIIDDIIDTAGTITNAAEALKEKGAKNVFIFATHAVMSGNAVKRLNDCAAKEVIFTNTIDIPNEKRFPKLKVLHISKLLAKTIKAIHLNKSLGKLYTWEKFDNVR
ncbi:ribose-phosphate pyrophosphokinase [archaeon]|jgi:ribose-phosphate pyrophosphokinase|nr:ribose-phosphate pyrophosphokinase [archaeon]MBT4352765.1 ribose-phosphate pyrophosphokinase [archaeon]MBT6822583.1 ribose-phosphate pyrophosphokinase [archaeon]MBT7392768.1 ribose-phosphate pyrophosphokinase [archaeon]